MIEPHLQNWTQFLEVQFKDYEGVFMYLFFNFQNMLPLHQNDMFLCFTLI